MSFVLLRQSGVLPMFQGRVCLITNRSGRQWILPKGCIEDYQTPIQTALEEAWEEAGVTGAISSDPVGSYVDQRQKVARFTFIYLLEVTQVHRKWPEMNFRHRCFLEPEEALERVTRDGLRDLLQTCLFDREQSFQTQSVVGV